MSENEELLPFDWREAIKRGMKLPPLPPSKPFDLNELITPEEQRRHLLEMRLERARIPHEGKTFATYDAKRHPALETIVQRLRDWYAGFQKPENRPGFVLAGSTGCGKTHLLVAMLRVLAEAGQEVHYFNVPDMFARLKDAMDDEPEETRREIMQRAEHAPVLALDDLAAEKSGEWSMETLYIILNGRYERRLSTLITTNVDMRRDAKALNFRIYSRLVEMCDVIDGFPGKDWRIESSDVAPRMK